MFLTVCVAVVAAPLRQPNPIRQHGKEVGMMLDLNKVSLGTLNDVEEKKQWIGKWNKNSNSKHIGSQESHEKMFNIADLQANAN